MAVTPTSITVQAMLSESVRSIMMNEQYVQAIWPLSELKSTVAKDLSPNDNRGTYTGSGFTRGVTGDLPEGNLGLTFDGNGYILIPDDLVSTGSGGMSLRGGSMDITFFMKTSTNDATLRNIVCKQLTNSAGNGYHVAMQNGAIEFYLEVAGVTIFNFQRGAVADGAWHLVHCYYDPPGLEAEIWIDGVQSGATVVTTNTDPAYQAVGCYIGTFPDLAGDFIGTLSYVMLGREGRTSLSTEIQAARSWTDLSADVMYPLEAVAGIQGRGVMDRIAQTGTLQFDLRNGTQSSGGVNGYYTPGHANVRTGWAEGVPIRLAIAYGGVTYYKFRGVLSSCEIAPGVYRSRRVRALCVDYMDTLARDVLPSVTGTSYTADQVIQRVLDEAGWPPHAVSLDPTDDVYVYVLDRAGLDSTLLTEVAKAVLSELGYLYVVGDTTGGGTLRFEDRSARQVDDAFDATFDQTMQGLTVTRTLDDTRNIVRVTVYPRSVDAGVVVVYALPTDTAATQTIPAGGTLTMEAVYTDVSQKAQLVGAVNIQYQADLGQGRYSLVPSTDFQANSAIDGTGTDLTAVVSTEFDMGYAKATIRLTNTSASAAYLRKLQLRGQGLYTDQSITVERRNGTSVRLYHPRSESVDLPYQVDAQFAGDVASALLSGLGVPRTLPATVSINGGSSAALLTQALAREPGDRIGLAETMSGLVTTTGFHLNGVRLVIAPGQIVTAEWTLGMPLWSDEVPSLWQVGEAGYSEVGDTTYLGL